MAVIFFAAAFNAYAQYQEYYILEQVGQENPSLYSIKIDWKNNNIFQPITSNGMWPTCPEKYWRFRQDLEKAFWGSQRN